MPPSAQPKKKNKTTFRKPPAWLYFPLIGICSLYLKLFYGLKINSKAVKGIKSPVLAISNHQSNLDFLIVPAALPLRLNFMVSTYFYNSWFLRWLLGIAHAIPKKQFAPDSGAIKSALRAAAAGCSIGLFPEGQVCYYGANCEIDDNVAKLIKKLGMPVINIAIRGNFITYPKYSISRMPANRGRIECTASPLFTAEEVNALDVRELAGRTQAALAYNDFEWQRQRMVKYRPVRRGTAGLENVLYRCPSCGSYFTMKSDANRLECGHCGYSVAQNRYGFFEAADGGALIFDNPVDWYRAQKEDLDRKLKQTENALLPIATPCTLYKTIKGKHGFTVCGQGQIKLNEKGLFFEGQKQGQPFQLATLYESQTNLAHNATYNVIDVHGEEENYGLRPAEDRMMLYLVELYSLTRHWVKEKKEQKRREELKQKEALERQEELEEQDRKKLPPEQNKQKSSNARKSKALKVQTAPAAQNFAEKGTAVQDRIEDPDSV